MKEFNNEIEFFESLIIRTPSLPFSKLKFQEDIFEVMLDNASFRKAILIANPLVYRKATQSVLQQEKYSDKKRMKLRKTLLNYWIRIHTKSVPFGFFSNVSCAKWGNETSILLEGSKSEVRLDMEVLHHIVSYLNDKDEIREHLKFYPNNTLYTLNEKFRYNEITYENNQINYGLSAVDKDLYLEQILQSSMNGQTIKELVETINDGTYSHDEYKSYIEQIINSQVLQSELQVNVIGEDPLTAVIKILKIIYKEVYQDKQIEIIITYLNEIQSNLNDLKVGENFHNNFSSLIQKLTSIFPEVESKKMIQVDSFGISKNSTIDKQLQKDLYMCIKFLSSFQYRDEIPRLEKFKKKFAAKYESAFLPLMDVIDTESGISFGDFKFINDNIFLNEISIEAENSYPKNGDIKQDKAKLILYKKYIESLKQNRNTVFIEDKDIQNLKSQINRMAKTCQVIFDHLDKDKNLISLITVGNSSGGNLISRFAYGSESIKKAILEITEFEKNSFDHSVVAEIAHIPEYRIGNVSFRPTIRDFEIPIVTKSTLPDENKILLSDLYVGIRKNRIVLLSKKLGKEVLPKLTNAHNYGRNTLPIYQFLSELSYQNIIPSLSLNKGDLLLIEKKIPRIQYKNIILSYATWNLDYDDLELFFDKITDEKIKRFRTLWNIPQFTTFNRTRENGILIDWESRLSIDNFLETVKRWKKIILKEFIHNQNVAPIKDISGNSYTNEIIASFKNLKSIETQYILPPQFSFEENQRNFRPGDEWVYLKLYCNYKDYDRILLNALPRIVDDLKLNRLIESFFFLPFKDPEFHIRIRFLSKNPSNRQELFQKILELIKQLEFIPEVKFETYKKELERYGKETMEVAEEVFYHDSMFIIENQSLYIEEKYWLPFFVIKQIDQILDAFDLGLEEKYDLLKSISNAYSQEFNIIQRNELKIRIDKKLNFNRKSIERCLQNGDLSFLEIDSKKYLENLEKFTTSLKVTHTNNREKFQKKHSLNIFLRSILHMHCIRCFVHYPRQNELFVYKALFNFYKKMMYLKK